MERKKMREERVKKWRETEKIVRKRGRMRAEKNGSTGQ